MPVAIVLSGGGSKGDFEVGALQCLYDRGIRPDIICACSAGALNGVKLAEGEGDASQGLQGLLSSWLGLRTNNADMYEEQPWLAGLDPNLKAMMIPPAPDEDAYKKKFGFWGVPGEIFYIVAGIIWLNA